MKVRFHRLALRELESTVAYYDSQQTGLGGEFAEEVSSTIAQVTQFPLSAPLFRRNARRILVNRFPYGVVFATQNDSVIIVAIMHLRRHPEYWVRRKQ